MAMVIASILLKYCSPIASAIGMIITLIAPLAWEKWDTVKIRWDDPRVKDWGWLRKAIFTSEQKFDTWDMLLGYAGIFIGVTIYLIGYLVWTQLLINF